MYCGMSFPVPRWSIHELGRGIAKSCLAAQNRSSEEVREGCIFKDELLCAACCFAYSRGQSNARWLMELEGEAGGLFRSV